MSSCECRPILDFHARNKWCGTMAVRSKHQGFTVGQILRVCGKSFTDIGVVRDDDGIRAVSGDLRYPRAKPCCARTRWIRTHAVSGIAKLIERSRRGQLRKPRGLSCSIGGT